MSEINGENLTPLGRAGTGGSFILGTRGPDALTLLETGRRSTAQAAQNEANRRAKRESEVAKQIGEDYKFDQDGSVYFGEPLDQQVYTPVLDQLKEQYIKYPQDALARRMAVKPILQRVNNETAQSKNKTAFLTSSLKEMAGDGLYNAQYANEHLAKALHGADGKRLLPSQFDAEEWRAGILGDHQVYNEKAVIDRTTKGLFPIISQKIAEAGQLGGQNTADTVRGRLVAFDGKGHPILNSDGSPKLNLTADMDNLLDSDPLFKLKTDARVADYEAKREASVKANATDPAIPVLPIMTRRGHHAQMVGPLAFYDTTHDEGLNAQVPRPRVAKDNPRCRCATTRWPASQTTYTPLSANRPTTTRRSARTSAVRPNPTWRFPPRQPI